MKHVTITPALDDYLNVTHSWAHDPVGSALRTETEALGPISGMLTPAPQGAFLTLLVRLLRARHILEVGTFTGYGALCLARGLPADGRLLCLDISADWTSRGLKAWDAAGLRDRIELRLGPAADSLAALPPVPTFDLAYVDADKPGYPAYLELILPRLHAGGAIVFDNMLQHGNVLDGDSEQHRIVDRLNRALAADPRVESALLPMFDGLLLARKK